MAFRKKCMDPALECAMEVGEKEGKKGDFMNIIVKYKHLN